MLLPKAIACLRAGSMYATTSTVLLNDSAAIGETMDAPDGGVPQELLRESVHRDRSRVERSRGGRDCGKRKARIGSGQILGP